MKEYKIVKKDPSKEGHGNYGNEAIDNLEIELWPNPNPELDLVINQEFPEFTCLCPRSGYPDFATVKIEHIPDKYVLEMKVLKLWLNSFRDRRISHEGATTEIFTLFKQWLSPKYLKVTLDYLPRGNLKTVLTLEYKK
jgi:7-cyano-7-deazaguanine reductase